MQVIVTRFWTTWIRSCRSVSRLDYLQHIMQVTVTRLDYLDQIMHVRVARLDYLQHIMLVMVTRLDYLDQIMQVRVDMLGNLAGLSGSGQKVSHQARSESDII
jgi:hypothetical protein